MKFRRHRACRWLRALVDLQCSIWVTAGLVNMPSDDNMVVTSVGAFPLEGLAHLAGSHLFVGDPPI